MLRGEISHSNLHLHWVVSLSILSADMRYIFRAIRPKQFQEFFEIRRDRLWWYCILSGGIFDFEPPCIIITIHLEDFWEQFLLKRVLAIIFSAPIVATNQRSRTCSLNSAHASIAVLRVHPVGLTADTVQISKLHDVPTVDNIVCWSLQTQFLYSQQPTEVQVRSSWLHAVY